MNHIVHAVQGEAAIVDGRSPTNVGSQFDGTPQSLSAGGFGKTDENGDTYISSSLDGSIYPYQLQNWVCPPKKSFNAFSQALDFSAVEEA